MTTTQLSEKLYSVKFQDGFRISRYSVQVSLYEGGAVVLPIRSGSVDVAPLIAVGGFDFLAEG